MSSSLSECEKEDILKSFRIRLGDLLQCQHDDRFLLRWLRARDFDIEKAETMLREDFKFRKKIGSDKLADEEIQMRKELQPYLCTAFLGFDNEGHAVRYIRVGCDLKGFIRAMTFMECLKFYLQVFELDLRKLKENNEKTGKHVEKTTYIVDYTGFILSQHFDKTVLQYIIQISKIYQDHYPETLHVVFVLNVPYVFSKLFNFIKPIINDVVLKKIKIFAVNDDSWKGELFSLIPKEIVPAYLGGARYETDARCSALINWDVCIPRHLYLTDRSTLKLSDPQVKQQLIRERSVFEVEKNIEKTDVVLAWEFETKQYSINFGVFYKQKKNSRAEEESVNRETLLAVENVDCSDIVEVGELLCARTGTYILHFNNSFSWIRPKELLYKIEVRTATELPVNILPNKK